MKFRADQSEFDRSKFLNEKKEVIIVVAICNGNFQPYNVNGRLRLNQVGEVKCVILDNSIHSIVFARCEYANNSLTIQM